MLNYTDQTSPTEAPAPPQSAGGSLGDTIIAAIYEDGRIRPLVPLMLPAGTLLLLRVNERVIINDTQKPEPQPVFNQLIEAVYQDGLIISQTPLQLQEGTALNLYLAVRITVLATIQSDQAFSEPPLPIGTTIEHPVLPNQIAALIEPTGAALNPRSVAEPTSVVLDSQAQRSRWFRVWAMLNLPLAQSGIAALLTRFDTLLLAVVALVYTLTRLIGLANFPIYFFSDEAIHANLAEQLLRNGLRGADGTFLPPYFRNVEKWNLSFDVYVQTIAVALVGKSVFSTRFTSAAVGLLAALAVALTLKLIFKSRIWWAGGLALSVMPVWFLHSRTAFETVMMVAFYACFLCCYLLYRYHNPRAIIIAILFGGATFYSYTNGQGVMLVSGVLLLLSDLRYHIQQIRKRPLLVAAALATLALTAAQYIRFRILVPTAMDEHLQVMNSYWLANQPLSEKLGHFVANYVHGLSMSYWFLPDMTTEIRHTVKGQAFIPTIFLPLALLGLWICFRNWRSSAHRAVLISVLAAPFAAALVEIAPYRALAMVVPMAIVFCLGLDRVCTWVASRVRYAIPATAIGVVLVVMHIVLLSTALVEGPTWFRDYSLGGMQYGGSQVFSVVKEELDRRPDTQIVMSHVWANNPAALAEFFLNDDEQKRFQLLAVADLLNEKRNLSSNQIFVLPTDDYQAAQKSNKLVLDPPLRIILYPDGTPGFYFLYLRYADNIDALIEAEREELRQLKDTPALLDGQSIIVRHPALDIGQINELFDHDRTTLVRGAVSNPMVYELVFPTPRTISAIGIDTWSTTFDLTITITPPNGSPQTFTNSYRDLEQKPHIDALVPGGPLQTSVLRIELSDPKQPIPAHIHIMEITPR